VHAKRFANMKTGRFFCDAAVLNEMCLQQFSFKVSVSRGAAQKFRDRHVRPVIHVLLTIAK
jgi:hypothetical protein